MNFSIMEPSELRKLTRLSLWNLGSAVLIYSPVESWVWRWFSPGSKKRGFNAQNVTLQLYCCHRPEDQRVKENKNWKAIINKNTHLMIGPKGDI